VAIRIRRRLTPWGNGFGIWLTRDEARKLGARKGDVVEAEVTTQPERNDVATLPTYHLGGRSDIDEVLEDEADARS
jgi:hypothetical protein